MREVNGRLANDPAYRAKYPKRTVTNMTVARALGQTARKSHLLIFKMSFVNFELSLVNCHSGALAESGGIFFQNGCRQCARERMPPLARRGRPTIC